MIFYCCRMQSQRSRWNTNNMKRTNLWSTQQTENIKKEDLSEEDAQDNEDDQELELFKKRMQSAPPRYQIIRLSEDEDQSSSSHQLSQVEEYKQKTQITYLQLEEEQVEDDTTRLSDESSIIQDYDQVPDDRPNIKPKSLEPFSFKKRYYRTDQS